MLSARQGNENMTTGSFEKDIELFFSIHSSLRSPETIGNAFQHDADAVINTIKAIEEALAEGTPLTRIKCSGIPVPLRLVRPRLQLLKPSFMQSRFWVQLGLSREDLAVLADSFKSALLDIEKRVEEKLIKAEARASFDKFKRSREKSSR